MLDGLLAHDVEAVTAIVKTSATSFYYGMKMLEPDRRDAMYGIYAFCRLVDDIADEEAPFATKRERLEGWRRMIGAVYAGQASNGLTRVLRAAVQRYQLREVDFIAIIDGMEMDAGPPIVAPPMPILDLYCDRVASAVGRLSVRVFGDSSPQAEDVAYALGRALQLTNILRDVAEDASRGRLYLPHEYLREAGVPLDAKGAAASVNLAKVCARLSRLAEKYFNEAETAMSLCNRRAMRPAKLMAASYRPLLAQLRAQGFDYSKGRARLPKWRKLLLAARLYLP